LTSLAIRPVPSRPVARSLFRPQPPRGRAERRHSILQRLPPRSPAGHHAGARRPRRRAPPQPRPRGLQGRYCSMPAASRRWWSHRAPVLWVQGDFSFDALFGGLVDELLSEYRGDDDAVPTPAPPPVLGAAPPLFPAVDDLLGLFKHSCKELVDLRRQVRRVPTAPPLDPGPAQK
jgi:hypothetical protein